MSKTLRLSGIVSDSIVDGAGIRMTVFTQGCPHNCKGCHNPQTHDFKAGYDETVESVFEKFLKNPMLKGITLSGGEPFCQADALIELCELVKSKNKDIWAYSGYTFEKLKNNITPNSKKLLGLVDVLVDGKFVLELRDLTLTFRGSSNQRIIDVKKSLAEDKVITIDYDE